MSKQRLILLPEQQVVGKVVVYLRLFYLCLENLAAPAWRAAGACEQIRGGRFGSLEKAEPMRGSARFPAVAENLAGKGSVLEGAVSQPSHQVTARRQLTFIIGNVRYKLPALAP